MSSHALNPHNYKVLWFAPLDIDTRAAVLMLDNRHQGRFPVHQGDDYIYIPGDMCGLNVVIAFLPKGTPYGTSSPASLAGQIKKTFPHLWFGMLVGVAAGLPNLACEPPRDIRLGDVLVGAPEDFERPGALAYDWGVVEHDGFKLLREGYALRDTSSIVRSAMTKIDLLSTKDSDPFLEYYDSIKDIQYRGGGTSAFNDPGQDLDVFHDVDEEGVPIEVVREKRPDEGPERTRVWYGTIGTGDKLIENAVERNRLRDKYDLIGLDTEAAGFMSNLPVAVIHGVGNYADGTNTNVWKPYAAAMAAAYAKAVVFELGSTVLNPKIVRKNKVT
ncbi:hypothetical protein AA313_de0207031 [Arthrobotrys entomopaga]|nr:hypothetical protein AA313_de0207031 [Arthrobotrys entomopaga]